VPDLPTKDLTYHVYEELRTRQRDSFNRYKSEQRGALVQVPLHPGRWRAEGYAIPVRLGRHYSSWTVDENNESVSTSIV